VQDKEKAIVSWRVAAQIVQVDFTNEGFKHGNN